MALSNLKVYALLSVLFFFSGLMQLSMASAATGSPAATAKAVDQAVTYLLMLAALFVTYLAH
uniref:Uncharacterized protein n=1 Tax=Leersia perrieri TaxID=77586 RepID=A0A0D9V2G7_9ORYZ